ncbi:MAG: hypothetical protein QOF09_5018 [Alphaproteobacteria bacterium]|jgi:hypothetical protein|nr:hypothetical protein [Alphaproteobacteria bacterium]
MSKKIAVCFIAMTMLASAVKPVSAAVVKTPSPPLVPGSSAALGVGGGLAVGIIATAGLLCIYDIWQKMNGLKNWDGSPKTVKARAPRRG